MNKEILDWFLSLKNDDEIRHLVKVLKINVSGFRVNNAPRSSLIKSLINKNKSIPLISELHDIYEGDPEKVLGRPLNDLYDLVAKSHREIPRILVTLIGSNEEHDRQLAEELFFKIKDQGLLKCFEDDDKAQREQMERESRLEKTIQELEGKIQSDTKRLKNIEDKLSRVTKNYEEETQKYKDEKTKTTGEKKKLHKENQDLLQENKEIKKQYEALNKKVTKLEQEKQILAEINSGLEAQVEEISRKSLFIETSVEPEKSESVPDATEKDQEKPLVALVGRSLVRRLLGNSQEVKFIQDTEAVLDGMLDEYDKVLIASFDLPFLTRKQLMNSEKEKVQIISDQKQLKSYLKREAR